MEHGELIVGNNLKLEESEIICDKCEGRGFFDNRILCPKCLGAGKVDWIDNVMGKKPLDRYSSSSYYASTSGTDIMAPSQKSVMNYINQHVP